MTPQEVQKMLKNVLLKDLRVNCRLHNLSPAGGKEQLSERLGEYMIATGNYALKDENGNNLHIIGFTAGVSSDDMAGGFARNNYQRPEGQNVGNFLTDRTSSRVLAPPGGGSSIVFGNETAPVPAASPARGAAQAPGELTAGGVVSSSTNNYARPGGQNVGNYLTDRHTVKISNPPGGASQITFG